MQFPVPQFTDVEDKIVGGLTFKQFGIVFVAGVLIFAVYAVSKSLVPTIVAGVLLGLPAIALAFGKLNGRPIYSSLGNFISFITGNNMYFFQKQAEQHIESENIKVIEAVPEVSPKENAVKIQQLSYLLHQQGEQESLLIGRLKETKKS